MIAWVQYAAQEIDDLNLKLRHAEKQSNELAAGLDLELGKKMFHDHLASYLVNILLALRFHRLALPRQMPA